MILPMIFSNANHHDILASDFSDSKDLVSLTNNFSNASDLANDFSHANHLDILASDFLNSNDLAS